MAPATTNDNDLNLLQTNPGELVVAYQQMIGIIVKKFIARGLFRPQEYHDTCQSVTASLLEKIPALQKNYNGHALVKTYVSAVIVNICRELLLKKKNTVVTEPLHEGKLLAYDPISPQYIIEHDVIRFATMVRLYRNNAGKLLLLLKLYFRIPLIKQDILYGFPRCSDRDISKLKMHFGANFESMPVMELYASVVPFFNKYEGKNVTADALRHWIRYQVTAILSVLNGEPPHSNYTEETLKILLEKYFHQL